MRWPISLYILVLFFWNSAFGWKWRTSDALIQEVWPENEESTVKFKRASYTTSTASSKLGSTAAPAADVDDDEDMLVFEGHYFKPNEVPPPPKFMVGNSNWPSGAQSPAKPTKVKASPPKTKTSSSFYYVTTVGTGSRLPPLAHKFTEENAKKNYNKDENLSAGRVEESLSSNNKNVMISSSSAPLSLEDLHYEEEEMIISAEDAPKCFTTTDSEGQCLPFKQCYPVVFNVINGDLRNPGLAKLLYQSSGPCNATLEVDFALSDKLSDDRTFFDVKFYNQSICCPRFKHPPTLLNSREDDELRSTRLTIINDPKLSTTPTVMRNTFKGYASSSSSTTATIVSTEKGHEASNFPESSSHPIAEEDSSVEAPNSAGYSKEAVERENDDSLDDDDDAMDDETIQFSADTELVKENGTDAVIKVEKSAAEVELYGEERRGDRDKSDDGEGKKSVDAFASVPAPNLSPNKCRHQIYGMPRGHWPWMVALVISSRHICSGALIDERHVITAAHCVYLLDDTDMKKLRIIIGDRVMYSTVDGPHFWRKVTKIITHVNYNQQTFASDIAILKMNSNVPFSRNVQPVSLSDLVSPVDSANFAKGIVAGWSGADIGQPAFEARTEMETVVDIIDKSECREQYRGFALSGVATNTFCTKASNSTCVADSGAPLIVRVQNCWVLGGIMSWGLGCSHFPEVYTDITRYTVWIRKHAV